MMLRGVAASRNAVRIIVVEFQHVGNSGTILESFHRARDKQTILNVPKTDNLKRYGIFQHPHMLSIENV